jgi:ATP-dependent protease ClpP protease subunit
MTAKMGRFRYWGDQKPDTSRPLLTFSRPSEAVNAKATTTGDEGSPATNGTLRIYGPIDSWGGFWGVSAKEVAQALDLLGDADRIVVRVNSPGGESSEGRAIVNLLRAHSAEIVTVVDGAAYSAASYIAACGNDTVMSPGSTMMIHDTSTILYGNAEAMRKAADVLDVLSNSGAELYAEIAGGTVEEWRDLQRAETWYSAAGAVESGLMKRVAVVPDAGPAETAGDDGPEPVDSDAVEDRARAAYDVSLFDKAPEGLPHLPTAPADGSNKKEGAAVVDLNDEQIKSLREQVGFPENADAGTIVTATLEALAERAEAPAESAKVPEGHVVIPAAKLADLEAGAALATSTAKSLADKERDAFLDSVKGKYLPTSRDGWAKEYDRDPQGVREHFKSAPVLIPTTELGHDNPVEDSQSEDDAVYAAVYGDEKKEA